MTVNPLVVDILIAIAVAAVVVLVLSGVATAGLIAALVLAACGISVVIDRRRARSHRRRARSHRRGGRRAR